MLIGVMSDSHDNLPKIKKAVEIFNRKKVSMIIHAGDYVSPFSLDLLDNLECPYKGIFGNNDGEKAGLIKKSNNRIKESPQEWEIDGKRVLVIHDFKDIGPALKKRRFDIIIHGHTHIPEICCARNGSCLIVNPGECCGWVKSKSSVALIDTEKMSAEIIEF